MASTKKGISTAVKIQPVVTGRKRRKSDLVIMWQSICHVTQQVLIKIHLSLLEVWDYTKLWIYHDEIQEIRKFLKQYLPRVPEDFSNSWRDGKLLCILLNKLHPGCIPEAEQLDPNYGLRNMYYAFDVLENKFGISPTASVEQLVVCIDGSDLMLLEILSELKKEIENNKKIPKIIIESDEAADDDETISTTSEECIAKGIGLAVAFAQRPANFNIFCYTKSIANLIIEIKGPSNTLCRERITKRSPRKKLSTVQLERESSHSFLRSISYNEKSHSSADEDETVEKSQKGVIPLEYDISVNHIKVTYIPVVEGQHKISIMWHGQHVSNSPYVVPVEPTKEAYNAARLKTLKSLDSMQDGGNCRRKRGIVTFKEPVEKIERLGKVINKRILRHIVKINGKDVVVDATDIDHLAAALLKMDYDFQTDPSKNRRNSWGFTGDAERKISVIRQFCVPPQEMEAQYMKLQKRSRSSTFNANSKHVLRRSTSFENEDIVSQMQLETVSESTPSQFESFKQAEAAFAEIDEDFEASKINANEIVHQNNDEDLTENASEENQVLDENSFILQTENSIIPELLNTASEKDVKNIQSSPEKFNEIPNNLATETERENKTINKCKLSDHVTSKQNIELCKVDKNVVNEENIPQKSNAVNMNETSVSAEIKRRKMNETVQKQIVNTCVAELDDPPKCIDKLKNLEKCLENYTKRNKLNTNKSTRINSRKYKMNRLPMYKYPVKFDTSLENSHLKTKNKHNCKCHKKFMKYFYRSLLFYDIVNNKQAAIENINSHQFKPDSRRNTYENNELTYRKHHNENTVVSINSKNKPTIIHDENQMMEYESNLTNRNGAVAPTIDKPNVDDCSNLSPNKPKHPIDEVLKHVKEKNVTPKFRKTLDRVENKTSDLSSNPDATQDTCLLLNIGSSSTVSNENFETFSIQEHNLVSLGQFNFKLFNPINEKNKGNLIRNKIKKLENAITKTTQKLTSKESNSGEKIDIQSKLHFWENVHLKGKKTFKEYEEKSIPTRKTKLQKRKCNIADSQDSEEKHSDNNCKLVENTVEESLNKEKAVTTWVKNSEDKFCSTFNPSPKSKRSFSDPGVLESGFYENTFPTAFEDSNFGKTNILSSTDNASSSTGADYLESSLDDVLSSTDAIISTEDEYIDDEISNKSLFSYWGDLSLMTSLRSANFSCSENYEDLLNLETLRNQSLSFPDECKIFGICTYYGYVAVKNRFRVLTKGAGHGNLSVSMEGFCKHDVSFVSVKYLHKDIYEVTYQVMRAGLYFIYIRWMERPITGSPFLCKITY